MDSTHELHTIGAHLLRYAELLEDFRSTITFILETPNPAMESPSLGLEIDRRLSQDLLKKECHNLSMQIERLAMSRELQDRRLKNVMNLVCPLISMQCLVHTHSGC